MRSIERGGSSHGGSSHGGSSLLFARQPYKKEKEI